jgi:phosphate transport system protein
MEKVMKHPEKELVALKGEISTMWQLVLSQLQKCKQSYLTNDMELAHEITVRERSVDSYELSMDHGCENYIALFAPVAIDLRLMISLIKISSTLERIADFADGIARSVIEAEGTLPEVWKDDLKIETMFDIVISMLSDSFVALETENTKISGKILQRDDEVDDLYQGGKSYLSDYVSKEPSQSRNAMETLLILRKIERIGDHCSNLVEEIVFYIDAKVLKHSKGKNNEKKDTSG